MVRVTGATFVLCRWRNTGRRARFPGKGYSSNLAGGTHHSFSDRGEGFCVLNDVAIAIRAMRARKLIQRAAIVDCDVHQGNGTATIFAGDEDTFTFSIHGANNYPLFKAQSTLDVELADGTSDTEYLETLATSFTCCFRSAIRRSSSILRERILTRAISWAVSHSRSMVYANATLTCCANVMNAKSRSLR